MNKRILLITGSYPPNVCGVGDYSSKLKNTLVGNYWELYTNDNWGFRQLMKIIKKINSFNCDIILMQFPTQGYGWSLIPHILCIYFSFFSRKKFITNVHELSQLSNKARLAAFIVIAFSNHIIFTNEYERNYASKRIPFVFNKSSIVKIFSNIGRSNIIKGLRSRKFDLINFGHIRPNKGLEEFINLISFISIKKDISAAIVGQVLPKFEDYFIQLKNISKNLNIEFIINEPEDSVIKILNDSKIAVLPFPDGISERRGSFLATINNGTIPLTTKGRYTTKALEEICYFIEEKDLDNQVIDLLENIECGNLDLRQSALFLYIKKELPKSWLDVSKQIEKICLEC